MTRRAVKGLAALALLALGGCASANVAITSPIPDVRVVTRGQRCETPCTLRMPVGRRVLIKAYDPAGLVDFTYEIIPQEGLNEVTVLGPPR